MRALRRGQRHLFAAALLACAAVAAQAVALGPDDLLDPEKAFRISARALDERIAEVEFKIAEGYYMYRNRFSFATESGKPLADVEIPRGKEKVDEFFGKTETFRDLVRIRVPLEPGDAKAGGVNLKVTSQGCADVGVCYAPLEQTVRVTFPGPASVTPRTTGPVSNLVATVPWTTLGAALAAALALGAGLAFTLAPKGRHGPVRELALDGAALALFAVAAWIAGLVLPDALRMLAWSAWLFTAAALLRALDPLPHGAQGAMRLAKAVGIAALVWAIAVLVGAASGGRDPLQPFTAWRAVPAAPTTGTGK